MTIEEARRLFCLVAHSERDKFRRFVRQMKHRQHRNLVARVSHWKTALGRRATEHRLRRIVAGPVKSAIVQAL
jgi:hypothetical protein